jgi:hypothetical protein
LFARKATSYLVSVRFGVDSTTGQRFGVNFTAGMDNRNSGVIYVDGKMGTIRHFRRQVTEAANNALITKLIPSLRMAVLSVGCRN